MTICANYCNSGYVKQHILILKHNQRPPKVESLIEMFLGGRIYKLFLQFAKVSKSRMVENINFQSKTGRFSIFQSVFILTPCLIPDGLPCTAFIAARSSTFVIPFVSNDTVNGLPYSTFPEYISLPSM